MLSVERKDSGRHLYAYPTGASHLKAPMTGGVRTTPKIEVLYKIKAVMGHRIKKRVGKASRRWQHLARDIKDEWKFLAVMG